MTGQFPISAADDLLIHQTPDPVRTMWTSDLQAYERFLMACHDVAGEVVIVVGGSFYPNLDAAEAFAVVNIGGRHGSVRSFRRLGADRMDLTNGPIRPTVVEGLRRWRYEVADNEHAVRLDLTFHDTTRQVLRDPAVSIASSAFPGRHAQYAAGFEVFGEAEGWAAVGDREVTLERSTCLGMRDRHWGTGRGVGGPRLSGGRIGAGGICGNTFVALPDRAIWGDRVFYRPDDPRPGAGTVADVHRQVRFDEDTLEFREAIVDYTFDDATTTRVHFERIGYQTAYLRCGLYGGTPDGRHYQGVYPGADLVEGDVHDVTDPAVRRYLAGLDEHQCRVTCDGVETVGIFQSVDPRAHRLCAERRPGWSFLC